MLPSSPPQGLQSSVAAAKRAPVTASASRQHGQRHRLVAWCTSEAAAPPRSGIFAGPEVGVGLIVGAIWRQPGRARVRRHFFRGAAELLTKPPGEQTRERLQPLVEEVKLAGQKFSAFSNEELQVAASALRQRALKGEDLSAMLPETFALVRETSARVLGLRHFDSQVMGGIVLHEGGIAEMATGEGKTLAAILPAFLHSLLGKGVHVVTTNDYLAQRDAELVGQPLRFLGASVGYVQAGMSALQRRQAYSCDVTYVTNVELGFDYLRDQTALSVSELRLRQVEPFHFAIVDEVDSVLIDEARTPLIISAQAEKPSEKYAVALQVVGALRRGPHYTLEEKQKQCVLTEGGVEESQRLLRMGDLFDPQDPWAQFIVNALNAREFYARDKEYIIRDDQVVIVDEFTGRPMLGRRWSNGLHQAVEAKEQVCIVPESMALASVSYQSFFRLFTKLAGMTGTALTEAKEFEQIYGLTVSVVPTNRLCQRKDCEDQVYASDDAKWSAVVREVQVAHSAGRPVLVGTTSVENSELVSEQLGRLRVPHRVLNARPESAARESEIIAGSGRRAAVTISTNMAGRGTDIVLGSSGSVMARLRIRETLFPLLITEMSPEVWVMPSGFYPAELSERARHQLAEAASRVVDWWRAEEACVSGGSANHGLAAELKASQLLARVCDGSGLARSGSGASQAAGVEESLREAYELVASDFEAAATSEQGSIARQGGLYVIGTERHESRRIDNQLRGRCGRQGDPGETKFFLSLNDSVFRVFGGDAISSVAGMGGPVDVPLSSPLLSGALDEAQKQVESYLFGIRKEVCDYDNVIDQQRQVLYDLRRRALLGSDDELSEMLNKFNEENMQELAQLFNVELAVDEWPFEKVSRKMSAWFTGCLAVTPEDLYRQTLGVGAEAASYLQAWMLEESREAIRKKKELIDEHGPNLWRPVWRQILLMQVDKFWRRHLQNMEFLKNSAKLRAYAAQDPLTEFKLAGYKAFLSMMDRIRRNSVYSLFTFLPQPLVPVDARRLDILAGDSSGNDASRDIEDAAVEDVRCRLEELGSMGLLPLQPVAELQSTLKKAGLPSEGAMLRWASAAHGLSLWEDEFAKVVYIGLEQ